MPTALITGITGQDGSYLAELLLAKGYRVVGVVRRSSTTPYERIAHLVDRLELVSADLLDQTSLTDAVHDTQPDEIYNLAAQSFVQTSWSQPVLTGEFTALGVTRMLEAMKKAAPKARFYQASSSEMFGKVVEMPQRESTPFYPRSPYGVAKVYGHWITRELPRELRALRGLGHPVQSREPAARARVRDAQGHGRASHGSSWESHKKLRLGNLDARRDWGFAGDYVDAMWRMLQQDEPDDYVVGTGETWSVRAALRGGVRRTSDLDYRDYVKHDARFVRPAEVDLLVARPVEGDASGSAGSRRCGSTQLVQMMVEADLARHSRHDVTRRALVTGGHGFVGAVGDRARCSTRRMVDVTAAVWATLPEGGADDRGSPCGGALGELDVTRQEQVGRRRRAVARPTSSCISPRQLTCRMRRGIRATAYDVNTVGTVRLLTEVARLRRGGCERSRPCSSSAARSSTGVTSASEMPLEETAEQRPADALRGLEGRAGDRGAPGAPERRRRA